MPDAVAFIQWVHYAGSASSTALFDQPQLSFSSKQHRLHELDRGDILWLVSRCPEDRQYYFVAALSVSACGVNESSSDRGRLFGVHRVDCDRLSSQALGRRFPAEGLLRALLFDSRKPIQYGASIGQALQTLRFLDGQDQALLRTTLARLHSSSSRTLDHPHGLWTKCDAQYARYFAANWTDRKEPLAFLLYDPPPALEPGAPVFIHSDRHLRLIARFAGAEFVAGHKATIAEDERLEERERVWASYRQNTNQRPPKAEFDEFWEAQEGVRGLFLMDELHCVCRPPVFKTYGAALQWGYPRGVGYRYTSLTQSLLLLHCAAVPEEVLDSFFSL